MKSSQIKRWDMQPCFRRSIYIFDGYPLLAQSIEALRNVVTRSLKRQICTRVRVDQVAACWNNANQKAGGRRIRQVWREV